MKQRPHAVLLGGIIGILLWGRSGGGGRDIMSVFYPGSTPIHTFTLPFSSSDCLTARVSYRQGSQTIITKTVDTFGGNGGGSCIISVSFTQAESMRFQDVKDISAQVNLLTTDNMRHPSEPIQISAGTQYYRKVIPDE